MATRTLAVLLRASVGQYSASMAAAAKATTPLQASLMRVQRAGMGMAAVGATLTRRVTVPLLAVGAGAVKMSSDFETSMTKITALVGLSREEVDGMRDSVLQLSGETAKSPIELADALFFITSAGLEGQVALDALEASAKASAAGLGETKTIADLVTSAMNAYGSETLSATQATDALTAAVRLGKLEPAELAGAMGRVLPIASAMGVEFEEVAAAFAAMSRTGTTASEAATGLRSVLMTILRPSEQAKEALAEIGMSASDLQRMLGEEGLHATLEHLVDAFGGNTEAVEKFFSNVRAGAAVMDLFGSNLDDNTQIFAEMQDVVGETDRAFEIMSETTGFKLRQSLTQLQTSLIRIGDVIAPMVAQIAEFGAAFFEAFNRLPQPMQTAAVAMFGVQAMIGPLMRLIGGLSAAMATFGLRLSAAATSAGLAGTAMRGLGTAATIAAGGIRAASIALRTLQIATGIGIVLAGLATAYEMLSGSSAEAEQQQRELADALRQTNGELEGFAVEVALQQIENVLPVLDEMGIKFADLRAAIDGSPEDFEEFARSVIDAAEGMGHSRFNAILLAGELSTLRNNTHGARDQLDLWDSVAGDAAFTNDILGDSVAGVAGEFEEARTEIELYLDQIRAMSDPLFAAIDASDRLADSTDAVAEAERELMLAHAGSEEATMTVEEAERNLERARVDGLKAARDREAALLELADAELASGASLGEVEQKLRDWAAEAGLSQDAADKLIERFLWTKIAADEMAGEYGLDIHETGADEVAEQAERVTELITGIPIEWGTLVSEVGMDDVMAQAADLTELITGIPVTWHTDTSEDGMDHVREQAFDLTEMITGIPITWHTDQTEDGMDHVREQAFRLQNMILGVPTSTHTTSSATDNASSVINTVASAARALDGTVATIHLRATDAASGAISAARGVFGGPRQHGGPVWPGQAFLVGEAGPELVTFGARGHVFSNPQTMSMARDLSPVSGSGGGRLDMRLTVAGTGGEWLAKAVHQGLRTGQIQAHVNGQRVQVG